MGGYAERHWKFYDAVVSLTGENSRRQKFEVKGDPSLERWLQVQRPTLPRPSFSSSGELRLWQGSLRHTLKEVFHFPDTSLSVNPKVQELSSSKVSQNITRSFLTFESFDGSSIPAFLFRPVCAQPRPAILVLPGHVGEHESGITQTAGIMGSYQNKSALALAEAGYVTMTIEFRGFGYLGSQANEIQVAHNAIVGGSFYKAILAKDIKYAVDLLQSFAATAVDPKRIGITGVSFGGEMAVTYAALDERIRAVVSQGYGGETGSFGAAGSSAGLHLCHLVPGQNMLFQQEDFFLLTAPIPMLLVRGTEDSPVMPEFVEVLTDSYRTLSAERNLSFVITLGGHEYFVKPAIDFFREHL
jgi:dienelactone hydrolase